MRTTGAGRAATNGAGPRSEQLTLMLGCFERGLFPGVSKAVQKLLPEISVPENQGCCGALHAHNGDSAGGIELAKKLGEELPGVIVTTAGGCAAHLATVLGRDRVHELSEHLVKAGYEPVGELTVPDGNGGRRRARVAIQDSCHLRNGLGVSAEPRALLGAGRRLRARRRRRVVLRVGRHLLAAAAQGRPPRARPQARRRRGGRGRLPRRGQPGLPAPVADRAGPAQEPDPRGAHRRPAGRRGGRAAAAARGCRWPRGCRRSGCRRGMRVRRVFRLRKDAAAQNTDGWSA